MFLNQWTFEVTVVKLMASTSLEAVHSEKQHFLLLVASDFSVCIFFLFFWSIYIYIHFFYYPEALKLPFTVCELWIIETAAQRCNNSSSAAALCREKFQPLASTASWSWCIFSRGSGRRIPLFFLSTFFSFLVPAACWDINQSLAS